MRINYNSIDDFVVSYYNDKPTLISAILEKVKSIREDFNYKPLNIDYYYFYQYSNSKILGSYLQHIYDNDRDTLTIEKLIEMIANKYANKWATLYKSLLSLNNLKITSGWSETVKTDTTTSGTTKQENKNESNGSNTSIGNYYAFNGSDYTPSTQGSAESNLNETGTATSTINNTGDGLSVTTHTGEETTLLSLIKDLSNYVNLNNLYDIIINDIDKELTLSIY